MYDFEPMYNLNTQIMIPTKVIHCKRSSKPLRGVSSLMRKVTCLRCSSPVETFYRQDVPCVHGKSDAVSYRTDIYMLFNQQRLDRMTLSQLTDYLDNQTPTSGMSQLRSKMKDEQLHQFIKSRYIQSPSELMAWSEYLSSEFERGVADAQKQIKDSHDNEENNQTASSSASSSSSAAAE